MMYKRVLIAIDLSESSLMLCKKAIQLAGQFEAKAYFVHLVENPVLYTHNFTNIDRKQTKRLEQAREILKTFGKKFSVSEKRQFILEGSPRDKLLDLANELDIDLIVVGSYGVGGYTHMLGSTARHILNMAHCDVLTMNIDKLKEGLPNVHFEEHVKIPHNEEGEGYLRGEHKKLKNIAESFHEDFTTKRVSSKKGVKQALSKGPRPGPRPPGTPYGRGEREPDEEED